MEDNASLMSTFQRLASGDKKERTLIKHSIFFQDSISRNFYNLRVQYYCFLCCRNLKILSLATFIFLV